MTNGTTFSTTAEDMHAGAAEHEERAEVFAMLAAEEAEGREELAEAREEAEARRAAGFRSEE